MRFHLSRAVKFADDVAASMSYFSPAVRSLVRTAPSGASRVLRYYFFSGFREKILLVAITITPLANRLAIRQPGVRELKAFPLPTWRRLLGIGKR